MTVRLAQEVAEGAGGAAAVSACDQGGLLGGESDSMSKSELAKQLAMLRQFELNKQAELRRLGNGRKGQAGECETHSGRGEVGARPEGPQDPSIPSHVEDDPRDVGAEVRSADMTNHGIEAFKQTKPASPAAPADDCEAAQCVGSFCEGEPATIYCTTAAEFLCDICR